MKFDNWGTATSIAGVTGFVVGGIVALFSPTFGIIAGVASTAGLLVVFAIGFLWRDRHRSTDEPPRRTPPTTSPKIDSFNLASKQHFRVTQPPPQLADFIDRQDENGQNALRVITDGIRNGQRVVVRGEGGVGKSVIAYQAAADVARRDRLELFWISASGREDFDYSALVADIAEFAECENNSEAVNRYLRDNAPILALDNLETVQDPSVVVFLKQVPAQCRLVITTRLADASLDGWGMHVRLEPMDEGRSILFVRQQTEGSPISENLMQGIAEVSEGIPEVMRQLISQQRKGVLPEAVSDLRAGEGEIAEKVFGRSFERLSDGAKTALCVLSLIPVADLDDLKFTTSNINVSGALLELGEWSLASHDDSGQSWWVSGLTRSLAVERLIEVLGNWYEKSKKGEQRDEISMRVLVKLTSWEELTRHLHVRGHWDEWIRFGERGAEGARHLGDHVSLMVITGNLSTVYMERGEIKRAEGGIKEALEMAEAAGDLRNTATGLHELGRLAQLQGRSEEADELYRRSLKLTEQFGDQKAIASTLHQLGRLAQDEGRLEDAGELYRRSLGIKERLGDQHGIATTLYQLGRLAQLQDRLEEADELYRRSFEISIRLGYQQGIAENLHELGILAQDQGDLKEADGLYKRSLEIKERLGNQQGIAISYGQLGLLAEQRGELEEAREWVSKSRAIFETLGSPMAEQARNQLERIEAQMADGGTE